MKNMPIEYSDSESNYIHQIQHIEKNAFVHNENFDQAMHFWNNNVIPSFFKLISKDTIRRMDVFRELTNENSIAEIIRQENDNLLGQATKHTQMRDLERQEAILKRNIEDTTHEIQRLKSLQIERSNSNMKKKLEILRNFAKVSKMLTSTNFEYKGPYLSGFIINGDSCQSFHLNPSKFKEQDLPKYLWDLFTRTTAMDWLDILNDM